MIIVVLASISSTSIVHQSTCFSDHGQRRPDHHCRQHFSSLLMSCMLVASCQRPSSASGPRRSVTSGPATSSWPGLDFEGQGSRSRSRTVLAVGSQHQKAYPNPTPNSESLPCLGKADSIVYYHAGTTCPACLMQAKVEGVSSEGWFNCRGSLQPRMLLQLLGHGWSRCRALRLSTAAARGMDAMYLWECEAPGVWSFATRSVRVHQSSWQINAGAADSIAEVFVILHVREWFLLPLLPRRCAARIHISDGSLERCIAACRLQTISLSDLSLHAMFR